MQIMSRKQALALKLGRYYSGRMCPQGHDAERYTYNRLCIECARTKRKKWNTGNPPGRPRTRPEGYSKPLSESTLQKQVKVTALPDDVKARLISRKEAIARGLNWFAVSTRACS